MRIFALGDLHLSSASPKPMDIFGPAWKDHPQKITQNWRKKVSNEDWVLICGDISWAMHLDEAQLDLNFIGSLPGKKILIKGNHDYWWKSISKIRAALPKGMYSIQNDFIPIREIAICGTRGWQLPGGDISTRDEKIYQRELIRAEISLKKAHNEGFQKKLFMLHYPPFNNGKLDPGFQELFRKYGVIWCVYGHLHGEDHHYAVEGVIDETEYKFVSCDFVNFTPVPITRL